METEIIGLPLAHDTVQGKPKPDRGSLPRPGFQIKSSADFRQAAAHVGQAVAEPGG